LAVCFLGGIVLGQWVASRLSAETGQELTAYLRGYLQLETVPTPVWQTALLYLRYPLLAALLGFSSVGVVLLPCTAVVFGLSLSFSVSCFTAAFGGSGALLAAALLGLRCAVTLPVFFLLAVPSWETAAALARVSFGKGRRTAPVTYGRTWWLRLAACGGVLLAGICLDLICTPWLLQPALRQALL
jgi:stage II sporulation protein M